MLNQSVGFVCDPGVITVWLRGNPLVRESEGLGAQVWLHGMSSMLLFACNLIKCHDIVCHYVYACCELASTFDVLTWRVMPAFRKV